MESDGETELSGPEPLANPGSASGRSRARWSWRVITIGGLAAIWFAVQPDPGHDAPPAGETGLRIGPAVGSMVGRPVLTAPSIAPAHAGPGPFAALTSQELNAGFIGRWRTNYHGTMTIEKRADHTAELQVDFDFLASLLYGRRLTMQLQWIVDGDTLTHTIVGGAPQPNLEKLVRDYGRTCQYRILEFTAERIRLQEVADPDSIVVWTRLSDIQPAPASAVSR